MKKVVSLFLIVCIVALLLVTLSSCGGSERKIAKRVEQLEENGEIEFNDSWNDTIADEEEYCQYWTKVINRILRAEGQDLLEGKVEWLYDITDSTFVFCFEKEKDSQKAMEVLSGMKDEYTYGDDDEDWAIVREGRVVLFGFKNVIDMILE